MHGCAQLCIAVLSHAQQCSVTHGSAQLCMAVLSYAQQCSVMHGRAQLCMAVPPEENTLQIYCEFSPRARLGKESASPTLMELFQGILSTAVHPKTSLCTGVCHLTFVYGEVLQQPPGWAIPRRNYACTFTPVLKPRPQTCVTEPTLVLVLQSPLRDGHGFLPRKTCPSAREGNCIENMAPRHDCSLLPS